MKLTASDGGPGERFGSSVASSEDGSTVLVGSTEVDLGGQDQVGAAYIYRRNGASWIETKLTPSDGFLRDWFGVSAALSADGDTALVGAPGDPGMSSPGAAYVYRWTGVQWEDTKLTPSASTDRFAASVSLSADGTRAAIGSERFNFGTGAVHIFDWTGTQWVETQLGVSDAELDARFGNSVALSGDGNTFVAGSRLDDVNGNLNHGSAYIFEWNGSAWAESIKLTASDGASFDWFGTSVAINFDGSNAVVGSPGHSVANPDQGQVYVYHSVIAGSIPALPDPAHSGSAYVFRSNGGGTWTETKLVASDGAIDDFFGVFLQIPRP